MSIIAPQRSIARRPHRVTFRKPGTTIPDGLGGFTQGPAVIVATGYAEIRPATAGDQERYSADTVLSHLTFLVTLPYVKGLTTDTVMEFDGRTFNVKGVIDQDERKAELVLVCDEVTGGNSQTPVPPGATRGTRG